MTLEENYDQQVTVIASNCDGFASRILWLAEQEGSLAALARKCGIGESTMRKWSRGNADPSRRSLIQISDNAPCDLLWLATGRKGSGINNRHIDDFDSEFVGIPQYNVEVAAGHGSLPGAETIVSRYAFRRDWIRNKGWSPDQLAIVINRGDSQEGVVDDGQPVLINLADHDIYKEGLFVIRQDDWLMLKIVQMDMQGNALIRSNNPLYREIQVPSNQISTLNIIGRAVWTDRLL